MTDEQTNNSDVGAALAANYILATLTINKWSARKPDRALAAVATAAHGAVADAVSVTRKLMAGADDELKAVEKVLNSTRTYLYDNSMPYSTAADDGVKRGPRIFPVTRSMEIIKQLGACQAEFNSALAAFKAVYNHRVTEALSKGWTLHGDPQYAFDAANGVMRCGQAVTKESDVEYSRDMKLGQV